MNKSRALVAFGFSLLLASKSFAVPVLSAMTTFGNGDGFRAPGEVVAGDSAGTATGSTYNYLTAVAASPPERGLAYNPVTGNLLLASRASVGQSIRILNSTTGADAGGLANSGTGTVSGGAINLAKVSVGADGAIYAANVTTNISTGALKVYQWANQAASGPTTIFNNTVTGLSGTPRIGDTMDVIGSGTSTKLAFGNQGGSAGGGGYLIVTNPAAPTTTVITSGSLTGFPNQEFNRGITFTTNPNAVWGRGQDYVSLVETTYATNGTVTGSFAMTSAQQQIDYTVIQGVPYLAVLSLVGASTSSATNGPIVTIYDATNPTALVQVASGQTVPNGTALTTAAGAGQVVWGGSTVIGTQLVTNLYALASNQGIEAFTFSVDVVGVPEASSFLAVGLVAAVGWFGRKRLLG